MKTDQAIRLNPEELVLYGLLVVIGAIPVAVTLARHTVFGFDATVGLVMLALGVIGLVSQLGVRSKPIA